MDELRLKKMEITLHNHNRRLDDHDKLHMESRKDIDMLAKILETSHKNYQESIKTNENLERLAVIFEKVESYAQKTYDVVKPLTSISGYVVKLGALALIVWHGLKWIAAKFVLLG